MAWLAVKLFADKSLYQHGISSKRSNAPMTSGWNGLVSRWLLWWLFQWWTCSYFHIQYTFDDVRFRITFFFLSFRSVWTQRPVIGRLNVVAGLWICLTSLPPTTNITKPLVLCTTAMKCALYMKTFVEFKQIIPSVVQYFYFFLQIHHLCALFAHALSTACIQYIYIYYDKLPSAINLFS